MNESSTRLVQEPPSCTCACSARVASGWAASHGLQTAEPAEAGDRRRPHREQRGELHQGLERERRGEAVALDARRDVARAEEDREEGEHRAEPEPEQRRRARPVMTPSESTTARTCCARYGRLATSETSVIRKADESCSGSGTRRGRRPR